MSHEEDDVYEKVGKIRNHEQPLSRKKGIDVDENDFPILEDKKKRIGFKKKVVTHPEEGEGFRWDNLDVEN